MVATSTVFELLASDTRRRLLLVLCETESVDVPEGLETRGGAVGRDRDSGQQDRRHPVPTDTQDGDPLELELRHRHLPKVASEGLVEWDRGSRTVSRGPRFDEVEPVLRMFAENGDRFPDASTDCRR